ncbi:DUF805 domain-containing protein [Veillonella sp.]|jgi:hypothetical protein|uniref:DUF805 domain-containing protein n=1 Tax=Veillonella sp. TaxID=1926307 RepID=UPI00290083E1|nr:DUF805 domain-containing protein [Veillonella sp.]MDU1129945.1 DUF805 domain-containing protein [Veillonella sp.]MDU2869238.1 DUF805 domain-containing protein [Veillonella sp.]
MMENFQQELKSMLSLSGRMNRRSYFMNLLMIFGIGYIGGVSISLTYVSKFFWVLGWLIIGYSVIRELAIASRRIHDLNGPTYLAILYIVAAIIALFVPTLAKVMLLVKVGLILMPGDKDNNTYGERPASMIVV